MEKIREAASIAFLMLVWIPLSLIVSALDKEEVY